MAGSLAHARPCTDQTSSARLSTELNIPAERVVAAFQFGGVTLANAVRESTIADSSRAPVFYALLASGNDLQRESIARGLGQAAAICATFVPDVATFLKGKVAESGSTQIAQAFNSGLGAAGAPSPPPPPGTAACHNGRPPASDDAIRALRDQPEALLRSNPNGGGELSSAVRSFAMTDPALLALILPLLPNATPAQRAAIAAGLGQAANACEVKSPQVTQAVQRFVVASANAELEQTFRAVVGDRAVGAIGAGGTGLGPGPGPAPGGPLGNQNTISTGQIVGQGGSSGTTTSRFSFASSSASVSETSNSSSTRIIYFSVSP
jgi:hypothetical protein